MNTLRNSPLAAKVVRCAIYTRKSTEEGLEQEFNSLDAQREAATPLRLGFMRQLLSEASGRRDNHCSASR